MTRKPQPLNIQPVAKRQSQHKGKGRFPRNPDQFPCPVCGEKSFEWGYIQGQVAYHAKKTMIFGGEPLRARVCQSCGNVLTFLSNSS